MKTDAPREELPRFIDPMLLRAGAVRTTGGWALEVEWDGMRAQVRLDRGQICVRSRPGRDCTAEFPELADLGRSVSARRLLLDGEITCLDDAGRPDFAPLRSRIRARDRHALVGLLGRFDGKRLHQAAIW